jgi:predicted AAA+ superfamily ATPase
MEIRREAYLNQLIERRDNGMIKVVTGIRRCGKSYLLFTIFKRYLLESGVPEDHIIEIALDGIENEELLPLYHGCHARRRAVLSSAR